MHTVGFDVQLRRIIDFANADTLKLIKREVLPSSNLRLPRSLSEARDQLYSEIVACSSVTTALHAIGISQADEFIDREQWRLDELVGVNEDVLNHDHFSLAKAEVLKRLSEFSAPICIFLPCHRIKPYRRSPTVIVVMERLAQLKLEQYVGLFVVSVPGISPLGMDTLYPIAYYDWDSTKENASIVNRYVDVISRDAYNFFKQAKTHFNHFIAYFRPTSDSLAALKLAATWSDTNLLVLPERSTIQRIKNKNHLSWRFRGLKSKTCLDDLCGSVQFAIEDSNRS